VLNVLDQTIRRVLDTGWTTNPPPAKPTFFFTVPDEEWRTKVKSGTTMRLNIYLYEVRESRELRRAEWDVLEGANHTAVLSRPPAYFDCHYILSAWSPTEDSEATTPVLDEHAVLAEALRVIVRNPDVVPSMLGIVDGGPVFRDAHVYLTVAPPETPRVLNDFWSTMKLPWRPAILLVATAPLDLLHDADPSFLVTSLVARYLVGTAVEESILFGGWVVHGNQPIEGATIHRVATGETAKSDAGGRFTFVGLRRGTHRLRVEAVGLSPVERDVDVPDAPATDHVFNLS